MATRRGVAAVCVFCVVAVLVFATSVKWKVVCTNYELNSYIGTYIQGYAILKNKRAMAL